MASSSCTIIGAGLVGSATALCLNKLGIAVRVFDKAPPRVFSQNDSRALVLSHTSKELLKALGLWLRIEKDLVPIREIQVTETSTIGKVTLASGDAGLDALGWSCDASLLQSIMHQAIQDSESIEVHWNAEFERVDDGEKELTVEVRKDGRTFKSNSELLVAADGSNSVVRRFLGAEVESINYQQCALVSTLEAEKSPEGTAHMRFLDKGSLALIPTKSGWVSVYCLPQELAKDVASFKDQEFLAYVEQGLGGRFGKFRSCGPCKSYPVKRLSVAKTNYGKCVILGNAANTLHPNAAQGLNLGFRDVFSLWKNLSEKTDFETTLRSFNAERRSDHRNTGLYTDILAQTASSNFGLTRVARRIVMRLINNIGLLKRLFILRSTGLTIFPARK